MTTQVGGAASLNEAQLSLLNASQERLLELEKFLMQVQTRADEDRYAYSPSNFKAQVSSPAIDRPYLCPPTPLSPLTTATRVVPPSQEAPGGGAGPRAQQPARARGAARADAPQPGDTIVGA